MKFYSRAFMATLFGFVAMSAPAVAADLSGYWSINPDDLKDAAMKTFYIDDSLALWTFIRYPDHGVEKLKLASLKPSGSEGRYQISLEGYFKKLFNSSDISTFTLEKPDVIRSENFDPRHDVSEFVRFHRITEAEATAGAFATEASFPVPGGQFAKTYCESRASLPAAQKATVEAVLDAARRQLKGSGKTVADVIGARAAKGELINECRVLEDIALYGVGYAMGEDPAALASRPLEIQTDNYGELDLAPLRMLKPWGLVLSTQTGYRLKLSELASADAASALRLLRVYGARIADFATIAKFPNLMDLSLRDVSVADPANDFKALGELHKLTGFTASGDGAPDASTLSADAPLEYLSLSSKTFSADSFKALTRFTSLRELDLTAPKLAAVDDIGKLRSLYRLELDAAPDANLSALAQLQHLGHLDLHVRTKDQLEPLAALHSLEVLRLYPETDLESLDFVRGMPELGNLQVYSNGNAIKDALALKDAHKLWTLTLRGCRLTDLGAFDLALSERPKLDVDLDGSSVPADFKAYYEALKAKYPGRFMRLGNMGFRN